MKNAVGVNVSATVSKVGRPKGTTNERKREIFTTRKKCLDSIPTYYATILAMKKLEGKRITKGFLEELIKSKRKEYNVSGKIAPGTIRSCLREGRSHNPQSQGATSLLEAAGEALVQICIQMGKICQPLNVTEDVALMNNLIDGTPFQEALAKFQKTGKLGNESFEFGRVLKGWWRGFSKQNAHRIVTKRGEKFATNRADWTKMKNIRQMYDVIYDELVEAGVALNLDNPMFTDYNGIEVEEDERFGLKQDIKITHLHYIMFADETGCNTSQRKKTETLEEYN